MTHRDTELDDAIAEIASRRLAEATNAMAHDIRAVGGGGEAMVAAASSIIDQLTTTCMLNVSAALGVYSGVSWIAVLIELLQERHDRLEAVAHDDDMHEMVERIRGGDGEAVVEFMAVVLGEPPVDAQVARVECGRKEH